MKRKDTSDTPDRVTTLEVNEPATLLAFLEKEMPQAKRTTLKQWLAHGQVGVNAPRPCRQWDRPLQPGDRVMVNTAREFKTLRHPRLHIVYEDDDILVVDKGYGLLSVGTDPKPGAKKEVTAYSILRDYLKDVDPGAKLFIVHRLDQHTSGLMMFAKTQEAKERMQHNWNNMVLSRTYVAVAEGYLEEDEGLVDSYLKENSRFMMYSTPDKEGAQRAVTHYKVLSRGHGYSLVELSLDTGRKNQIRVHLHDMGHPIAGDRRYGAKTSPLHRMCLHARTLRFVHPMTRKDMNFTLPEPTAFGRLCRK